ncbi:MAG: hypothetical protein QXE31_01685 [Candidatus Woesearchaeota archaeon]
MLEKALFRKHTKLFLYMSVRQYFSQKELIIFSLSHREFKDKDSIENKGQFLDKLINLGIIKKYKYKDFIKKYPEKIRAASIAYQKSHERKRIILEFKIEQFLALDFPFIKKIKNFELPFKEYINQFYDINTNKLHKNLNYSIKELITFFLYGCSLAKIYFTKYEKILNQLKKIKYHTTLENLNKDSLFFIKIAQEQMESKLKNSF